MNPDTKKDLRYWWRNDVCDWRMWIPTIIYLLIVIPLLIIHYRTGW